MINICELFLKKNFKVGFQRQIGIGQAKVGEQGHPGWRKAWGQSSKAIKTKFYSKHGKNQVSFLPAEHRAQHRARSHEPYCCATHSVVSGHIVFVMFYDHIREEIRSEWAIETLATWPCVVSVLLSWDRVWTRCSQALVVSGLSAKLHTSPAQ